MCLGIQINKKTRNPLHWFLTWYLRDHLYWWSQAAYSRPMIGHGNILFLFEYGPNHSINEQWILLNGQLVKFQMHLLMVRVCFLEETILEYSLCPAGPTLNGSKPQYARPIAAHKLNVWSWMLENKRDSAICSFDLHLSTLKERMAFRRWKESPKVTNSFRKEEEILY